MKQWYVASIVLMASMAGIIATVAGKGEKGVLWFILAYLIFRGEFKR